MRRTVLIVAVLGLATAVTAAAVPAAARAPARPSASPAKQVATLKREVRRLRATVQRLRAANAALAPQGIARQLDRVRTATAQYATAGAATAAGYVPASPCESQPGTGFPAGAMGFHYLNPPAAGDQAVAATKPEVLLYAPGASGVELVGVEYFKADADQSLATDDDRPSLFGRAFDGPMLGHAPGMPIHFDLHVWLQKRNPSGTFAQWNPDVRCP